MRRYESVVVFSPNLNDSQLKDEIKKVQTLLETNKAGEIEVNNWGKKEIAYLVGKEKLGNYVAFNYDSDNHGIVSSLNGILRITENVMKFQSHVISSRTRKFKGNPKRKTRTEEGGEQAEAEFN